MLALPLTSNFQNDSFARRLGTASILLALAGMLPASFKPVDLATVSERFHFIEALQSK